MDSYWIYCLDPCQNFEGVYNYSDMSAFQGLVEYLGGTYTCDEWEAEWSIGDNIWQADLIVVDSQYENFIVRKNGQELILDDPYGKSNRTTSGRAFSIADLEQLVGITLQDDQMAATLSPLISIIVPRK